MRHEAAIWRSLALRCTIACYLRGSRRPPFRCKKSASESTIFLTTALVWTKKKLQESRARLEPRPSAQIRYRRGLFAVESGTGCFWPASEERLLMYSRQRTTRFPNVYIQPRSSSHALAVSTGGMIELVPTDPAGLPPASATYVFDPAVPSGIGSPYFPGEGKGKLLL